MYFLYLRTHFTVSMTIRDTFPWIAWTVDCTAWSIVTLWTVRLIGDLYTEVTRNHFDTVLKYYQIQKTHTMGYQKVRRRTRWNQYLFSNAYKFCRKYKQKMFYQLWKFKLDIFYIYLSSNTIYMVWSPGSVSVEFSDVLRRHCFSVLLYTLIHFWLSIQRSNTNLIKQSFLHEYKIWRTVEWSW